MLSLASSRRSAAFAAVASAAAHAFPLAAPWSLVLLLVPFSVGLFVLRKRSNRIIWLVLCTSIAGAVLAGIAPAPIAIASLSFTVLIFVGAASVGAALLLLNMSVIGSAEMMLAQTLDMIGLEAAAPAMLTTAVLVIARPSAISAGVCLAAVSAIAALVADKIASHPYALMIAAAVPATIFSVVVCFVSESSPRARSLVFIAIAFGLLLPWAATPPRSWGEIFVLLPDASDTYEAQFFKNYTDALRFAGIRAERVTRLNDIPSRSLVLMPWTSADFKSADDNEMLKSIGQLAQGHQWTVIVGGEHTNLGGAADRIEAMSGKPFLRRDLTVPPYNTDDSGPLHVSDLREWPHGSILNRGASVEIMSLLDKVLLAGDGWWAEPDLGEWLWVGDYIWRSGERAGRMALAIASDSGGARWIIVGDNSFFLSNQIYADPRTLLRLIELASLWPALVKDIAIGFLAIAGCLLMLAHVTLAEASITMSSVFFVVSGIYIFLFPTPESSRWRDTYVDQIGFDERNFNLAFTESPLLTNSRRLMRLKGSFTGEFEVPHGNAIIFLHVDGTMTAGKARLTNCRRLGALALEEGPYLMDAQACRVTGADRILIGTPEAAVAFSIQYGLSEAIFILDTVFLGQKAPSSNADWLIREMAIEKR